MQIDKWIEDGIAAIRDYVEGKDKRTIVIQNAKHRSNILHIPVSYCILVMEIGSI